MSNLQIINDFLICKFKASPFSVWIHNPNHVYPSLIFSYGKIGNEFPKIALHTMKPSHHFVIEKNDDHYILFFYYPDNYQISVIINNPICSVENSDLDQLYFYFHYIYSIESLEAKTREIENLTDSIRSITSSLELNDVLKKITSNAIAVIPGADAGFLMLYDAKIDRLVLKTAIGFNKLIHSFKAKIGESITGSVFQDQKARIFLSNEEVFEEMKNKKVTEENLKLLTLAVTTDNRELKGAICVPVSIGKKNIGVMILHQFNMKRNLTRRDLNTLQAFADQAAIAIQNAKLFSDVRENYIKVAKLSKQLKEKNRVLQKRNTVHETLTRQSMQNKGINSLILELNRMLMLPVLFINMLEGNYFPTHSSQIKPISIDEISLIFDKNKKPIYVDVYESSKQHLFLYPIVNGTVLLGCLVVNVNKPLTRLETITIEQGGSLLALEIVKKQSVTEIYFKKTFEFFQELLKCNDTEMLMAKGKEVGLDLSSFLTIARFEITQINDLPLLDAYIHRLVSIIKTRLQSFNILVFGTHNKVSLLCAFPQQNIRNDFIKALYAIFREWSHLNLAPLCIGIGNTYSQIENISKTYDDANKALSYLVTKNEAGIIEYEDIGINRLFLHQDRQEIEGFINNVFASLYSGNSNSQELEQTLISYISNSQSAIQTAEKLHIHINTLYKRLKKIESLLDIDFNRPEDILKVQLACHLKQTFI